VSPRTHIRIDRLAVRMQGVPPETVRSATAGLGAELATQLAAAGLESAALGTVRVGRVDAPRGATAAELRSAVARETASAVAGRARREAR